MEKIKYLDNFEDRIDPEILNIFPYNFLKNNCFIPVLGDNGDIFIVTSNPLKIDIGEIKTILKKDVRIVLSSEEKINDCIEKFYYHPSSSKKVIDDLSSEEIIHIEGDIDTETSNLLDLANKAPVIRIVNQIIYRAISMRASDIHLQVTENSLKVRYRIDGVLHDIFVLPKKFHPPIVTRIKIMSNLDIAEKRIPQDGRTSIKVDSKKNRYKNFSNTNFFWRINSFKIT
jgi:type IV pilus assembly protein PilB